jgi:hypothetical protein
MPNPLRKLPKKPGRTTPSSRVKKIVKEGNKKFICPKKLTLTEKEIDKDYNPYPKRN